MVNVDDNDSLKEKEISKKFREINNLMSGLPPDTVLKTYTFFYTEFLKDIDNK